MSDVVTEPSRVVLTDAPADLEVGASSPCDKRHRQRPLLGLPNLGLRPSRSIWRLFRP